MTELNKKFLENISKVELLKFYGDELLGLFDYSKDDFIEEQLKIQARAIVANFIEQLIDCLNSKPTAS